MKVCAFYKTRKFYICIWITSIVLWTGFIFAHSLMNAQESGGESARLLELVNRLGRLIYSDFELSHNFLRKCAHFFEYFVLGSIWSQGIFIFAQRRKIISREIIIAGLLTALFDETLQLFSNGRSASVNDVWLDFSAFVFAFLIIFMFFLIKSNIKKKKI